MGTRPVATTDGVRRFATALDRFVRHVTQGEHALLDPDVDEIPPALLDEARLLLASLSLSSDAVVQAIAAREVQRARALSHNDESGRVTATRVLYAVDRHLTGMPEEGPRKRRGPVPKGPVDN